MQERELRKLKNDRLPPGEMERIKSLIARTKRFAELCSLLPYARGELDADFEGFLKKHGLSGLREEDMKLLCYPEQEQELQKILRSPDAVETVPEPVFRYLQYQGNKLFARDHLIKTGCAPSNQRMRRWRERQINRCLLGLGGVNRSFVHTPFVVELSQGCSVGCPFCGLGAKGLTAVCRYTQENAELFRGILSAAHRVIGDAAGTGTLYLATEALDDPDYEKFEEDYFREFGHIPQITTAVPDRDIERTRRLVHELYEKPSYVHRFSIRSVEMAEKIFEAFTPEELLSVELIPQFPEAPSFVNFTVAGSQIDQVKPEDVPDTDPGTICCIDGFVANMTEKSLRILTPCHMTEQFPNGISEPCKRFFETAEEFEQVMQEMMEEYMIVDLPEGPLQTYPYLHRQEKEDGDCVRSEYGGSILVLDKLPKPYAKRVMELLLKGTHDKHEIVHLIRSEFQDVAAEDIFWYLNQFWKQGYIYDSKLFG